MMLTNILLMAKSAHPLFGAGIDLHLIVHFLLDDFYLNHIIVSPLLPYVFLMRNLRQRYAKLNELLE